jgi:hypothetical protein
MGHLAKVLLNIMLVLLGVSTVLCAITLVYLLVNGEDLKDALSVRCRVCACVLEQLYCVRAVCCRCRVCVLLACLCAGVCVCVSLCVWYACMCAALS